MAGDGRTDVRQCGQTLNQDLSDVWGGEKEVGDRGGVINGRSLRWCEL
jgi:hypothetical protein